MTGTLAYSEVFWRHDAVGLRSPAPDGSRWRMGDEPGLGQRSVAVPACLEHLSAMLDMPG